MNPKVFFDAEAYFSRLCEKNRLAQERSFQFCTCSGIQSLQGPLDKFRSAKAFFCIDDTNDGALFQGKGGGWYKKRTFTVFIMHRYTFGDEGSRRDALAVCRNLFRQLMTKMIVDADFMKNELIYLHTDNVMSRELGQYFLNGGTGLYFMIDVSEPVNLVFDSAEWIE